MKHKHNFIHWRLLSLLLKVTIGIYASNSMGETIKDEELWRQLDWRLDKEKHEIQIYSAKKPNSRHRAVYGKVLVKANIEALVALIADTERCPQWVDRCKESRTLQRQSHQQWIVYSYIDLPFPAANRYVVAQFNWQNDPETGRVSLLTQPVTGWINKPEAIRIEQADSRWYFTPINAEQTQVENYAHIDPKGMIPAWLNNTLQTKSPYKTLKRMRKLVEPGVYKNANIPLQPIEKKSNSAN